MYAEHFRLFSEPFDLTPNPKFLYLGKQYRVALGALQYGLADQRGFMTLIGEVGTGKTTLIFSLLSDLPENIQATFISFAGQPFPSLVSLLLTNLGVPHDPSSETEMLAVLQAALTLKVANGQTVALIIDEAQNLSDQTLERLRLLSNLETASKKLLQVVLVGQPELRDRLHRPHLRQLNERVSVRATLNPLSRREIATYVRHRLQRAGSNLDLVVSPTAQWLLLRRAWGIPRRVNILFHNALLFAFGQRADRATVSAALQSIREMNDQPIRRFVTSVVRQPAWGAVTAAAIIGGSLLVSRLTGARQPGALPSAGVSSAPVAAAPLDIARAEAQPPADPASAEYHPLGTTAPARSDAAIAVQGTAAADLRPNVAPAPELALAAGMPAKLEVPATVVNDLPAASRSTIQQVPIPTGASLSSIARTLYGHTPSGPGFRRFLETVQSLNPDITDPNLIIANRTLWLPSAAPGGALPDPADRSAGEGTEG